MKKILLLIFFIILFASGYYYYNKNNGEVSTTTYEFIKIEKGNIKKIVSATGKIIPTSSQILSSEISGKIVSIEKDFNQIVKQGDTLAVFDQNPFLLKVKATETEVDISNIEEGQSVTVKWRGKPVFIRKRSKKEIEDARNTNVSLLPDPEEDSDRVKKEDWLILVGVCTHLGCVPLGQKISDKKGDYNE